MLLTRKGIDRKYRQEAIEALAKINQSDPVVELLTAIGNVDTEDKATLRDLVSMLSSQKPAALAAQRQKIEDLAVNSENPTVKQVAYGALAAADGKPEEVWKLAEGKPDGLRYLLGGLYTVADSKVRASFYDRVKPLAEKAPNVALQVAAIDALSYLPGHEADAFKLLADLIQKGEGDARAAAVRSVARIPAAKWPKDQVAPLAQAVVKLVEKIPADKRTGPEAVQAVQLGNDLAAALPAAQARPSASRSASSACRWSSSTRCTRRCCTT